MKKYAFIVLGLLLATTAFSQKYYQSMYEPADNDKTTQTEMKQSKEVNIHPINPATDKVPESQDKISESTDIYTKIDGGKVTAIYHVVVGSFQSRINAENLCSTLKNVGKNSFVAQNQQGMFRVFYYSTNAESEVRQALTEARTQYPDAWMLKLK
ncbi:MAG TPA: SPOR domain-containing protein [Candidatus Enterocola sp.]|nr:SPOR domain-containing protein [Candidatus Enterocola sp.]HPG55244.1 SPOR domain-containing protein [Candidatus Enterocola sp.]